MLFVFAPDRAAIFLVAGDGSRALARWYDEAIPLAKPAAPSTGAVKDKKAGR